jgi:hypothetical protein
MISLYVRMADGRDRGHVLDVIRETALELIDSGQAQLVDPAIPGALDFIPDFTLPKTELTAEIRLDPARSVAETVRSVVEPQVITNGGAGQEVTPVRSISRRRR